MEKIQLIGNLFKHHVEAIGLSSSDVTIDGKRILFKEIDVFIKIEKNKSTGKVEVCICQYDRGTTQKRYSILRTFNSTHDVEILRYTILCISDFLLAKTIERNLK